MKKFWKILILLILLCGVFLLGWRVMPKVWPGIKEAVVYPVLPDLRPAPAPTAVPYTPKANASLNDSIADTDSLIYYFYRPTCPYCAEIEPLMAGLPEYVTLEDGARSQVMLVAVNKSDEAGGAFISAYYEAHAIPETEQYVPAVIIGDQYLMPGQEVIDNLSDLLQAGEGLRTPRLSAPLF